MKKYSVAVYVILSLILFKLVINKAFSGPASVTHTLDKSIYSITISLDGAVTVLGYTTVREDAEFRKQFAFTYASSKARELVAEILARPEAR